MSGMDAQILLVGRYRLDRRIGSGGMGHVWAAHDTVLGRDVAVKVQQFDPHGDWAAFERFVREARTAAGLQHPNVVTIFDSGTDGDTAFLVMELLPGPTLDGYVAQHGPLPEREAVALAGQVASGLAAAHGAGVVHRDIKPANLMFDARGTLKIVDFGIAHLAQTAAARLTAPNTVIGSPPYLSPEQLQGRPADERSDLYALGCVITTMLTGRPPFEAEHPLAFAHQHVSAQPHGSATVVQASTRRSMRSWRRCSASPRRTDPSRPERCSTVSPVHGRPGRHPRRGCPPPSWATSPAQSQRMPSQPPWPPYRSDGDYPVG